MAKYEASPRNDIVGREESVGWERDVGVVEAVEVEEGVCAADLPRDPWNWVLFDPQPTLMNLSITRQLDAWGRQVAHLPQSPLTGGVLRG
jgi:hypothetical protein